MDTFDRISQLLEDNKMTQADLSRATGISTSLISQWKKRMQSPSTDKLKLIAEYFSVSFDWLLYGDAGHKERTLDTDAELENVYLSFARDAQREGIPPSDIRLALDTIKRLRGE